MHNLVHYYSVLTKQLKTKRKNKISVWEDGGVLSMFLDKLGATLLGNLVTAKRTIRAGKDRIKAWQDF